MKKFPYCLEYTPICKGGALVSCWGLIENGDAFLCPAEGGNLVYGVESLEGETLVICNEKTNEKYTLNSDQDCSKFNVYWKADSDFERV